MRPWCVVATTMAPRSRKWSTMATPERAAFGRIGPRAHLVEQHEGGQLPGRGSSPRWWRGGRRTWRGSRRSTARRRCRRRRGGRRAARAPAAAGTCRPDCAMRAKQAEGLEGHRLAAGVGAADDEHRLAEAERAATPAPARARDRRASCPSRSSSAGMSSGMARLAAGPARAPRVDLGLQRLHVAGEQGHGLGGVQLAQDAGGEREVVGRASPTRRGQLGAGCGSPRAAPRPAARTMSLLSSTAGRGSTNTLWPEPELPWMMPGELALVLGLQQQHVAVVARGDELVLQEPVGVAGRAGTTPSPTVSWLRRRASVRRSSARRGEASSATSPLGQDGAADGRGHLGRVAHLGGPRREPRGALGAGHAARDLDRRLR